MFVIHKNIIIKGRVQGVFYRASARKIAKQYNVTGWIRNNSDGSVSAEVEGAEQNVQAFIDWCRKGPPNAQVRSVQIDEGEVQGYEEFWIERGE